MSVRRYDVLGVAVSAVDYAGATRMILDAAHQQRSFAATALAVHGVVTGHRDPWQRIRINALDLVTPDGQPVRWALNWLHDTSLIDRVYGPFLMLHVCERAAAENLSVFLYGSDAAVLAALSRSLQTRFPTLRIAGTRPSRFRHATEAEWQDDVRALGASGADIVFCGLGCPRQEAWVYEMRPHLRRPLVAVGAAFAFWAGRQPMAPRWMQRAGMEWLFRLAHEPRRLAGRYAFTNPWFLVNLLRQKLFASRRQISRPVGTPPALRFS
jgi:N-acetylglucosaminyldiphosphoundecaprenol N-acetyl-beta-D-mannosaminyltransferase